MAYVRSGIYFLGFGALGYFLMKVVSPNEAEFSKELLEGRQETKNELLKKRQAFVDALKAAAERPEPIYRQSKEEIEKSLKKEMMDKSGANLHEQVAERMKKRDNERLHQIESKRDMNGASNAELVADFSKLFYEMKHGIEESLHKAADLDKNQLPDALIAIKSDTQDLQKYLSTSTLFLCRYDIRRAQESIQEIMHRIQEIEEKNLPKKKFAFKFRKNKEVVDGVSKLKIEDTIDSSSKSSDYKTYINTCGFSDKMKETLVMSNKVLFKQDVTLTNLEGCIVKLNGMPSTMHMSNLNNCTILSGPVVTSVLIEGCFNCKFVFPCQQLRVHNTKNSDFYIHVTTKAIIEDCSMTRFAPFNWKYDGIQEDYKVSGLDQNRNHWSEVDDFNWLAADRPSPNWSILEEADRIISWDESIHSF